MSSTPGQRSRLAPGVYLGLVLGGAFLACATAATASPSGGPAAAGRAGPLGSRGDSALERRMRERVLHDRRAEGRGPLTWDPALVLLARRHDRDMIRSGYVGHVSPTQGGPRRRLARAGYYARTVRENVAVAPTVDVAERGLLASPPHHENLMARDVERFGIGIVRATDEQGRKTLYVTQLFATPIVPTSPEAVETELVKRIGRARLGAGVRVLRPLPLLSALARRYVAHLALPVPEEELRALAREALDQGAGQQALAGVSVGAQTVSELRDLVVPAPALDPAGRYLGVAAVRREDAYGQPSVLVLVLVGQAAPATGAPGRLRHR